MNKVLKVKKPLLTLLFIVTGLFILTGNVSAGADGVSYTAHVEDYGWRDPVSNGQTAGTTGESKRVEALKISLINPVNMGITYQAHVQDIGWQDPVSDGAISGTEGQSKAMEAIKISLSGTDAPNYHVYYRVHSQNVGWLGWAKDGENAGTSGQALRMEAIEIKVLNANDPAPQPLGNSFVEGTTPAPSQPSANEGFFIRYKVLSNNEWTYGQDSQQVGCGQRIDGFAAMLPDSLQANGGLQYRTLNTNIGWSAWTNGGDNQVVGQPAHGMQALRMKLTGKLQHQYDIYYRVHSENIGWTNWAKNGEACGSEDYNRNILFLEVKFTNKGDLPAPLSQVGHAFFQPKWIWPVALNYRAVASPFGPRSDNHHDGIDISAPRMTHCYAVKDGIIKLSSTVGAFGNYVCLELDSGEMLYYGHLDHQNVQVNQRVKKGDVVGFVGMTGNAEFYHLHLEVFSDDGSLVNPMTYF